MSKYVAATGRPSLDGLGDILNVVEAATATGVSSDFIRAEIRAGRLKAFVPGGRPDASVAGRGLGYRIHKAELQRWFLGEEGAP